MIRRDGMRLTVAADIMDGDWVEERGIVTLAVNDGKHVTLTFNDHSILTLNPNDEVYYE